MTTRRLIVSLDMHDNAIGQLLAGLVCPFRAGGFISPVPRAMARAFSGQAVDLMADDPFTEGGSSRSQKSQMSIPYTSSDPLGTSRAGDKPGEAGGVIGIGV